MPLDKKKLRQFKKDAFNKMSLIKRRVVVAAILSKSCSHLRRPTAYKRHRAAASGEHHTPTRLHSAEQ